MASRSLFVFALLLFACLLSVQTTSSTALIAAADDPAEDDPAVGLDDADMPPDEDEDEEDDDEDADDAGDAPDAEPVDPDAPAVIDPEGEENASYSSPYTYGALFFDDFQSGLSKWAHTSVPDYSGEFKVGQGANPTFKGDRALIIPVKARKYAISAKVDGLDNLEKDSVVLQFEVKLDQGMTCGGAYMKLPTASDFDPAKFDGSTGYSIMFGPDRCGPTDKVHFIFQSKNPITGKYTEHHLIEPPTVANTYDKKTHLYTIVVNPDDTFQMLIDDEVKKDGKLSDSFEPPIQPPEEINDPDDKKPGDWVNEEKIPDPDATKPDDWDEDAPRQIEDEDAVKPEGWLDDEPTSISDPDATKPEEWDDDEDGEWEAPTIPNAKCDEVGCGEWKRPMKDNPAYKGKWEAPLIKNPKYIGKWKPRKIANPDYYEVTKPALLPIHGLGFEIWTMDQGVLFDNVWLGKDIEAAEKFRKNTFVKKQKTELDREEEANRKAEEEEKATARGRTGKLGLIMDKIENAIDRLEDMLKPLEDFIIENGGDPYVNKIVSMGVQKPMIMVVAFPIALVLLFLIILGGGKKAPTPQEAEAASTAEKKKTDEPTPDDAVEDVDTTSSADSKPEPKVRQRRPATTS